MQQHSPAPQGNSPDVAPQPRPELGYRGRLPAGPLVRPPAPPPPARPRRLLATIVLLLGCAAVMLGLILVIALHMAFYPFELLYDMPVVPLVFGLGWMMFLALGLSNGRRWSRFAIAVTVPIQVPCYALFLILLGPVVLGEDMISVIDQLRYWAVILCATGIPLAIAAPLSLIGRDMTTYLNRPDV